MTSPRLASPTSIGLLLSLLVIVLLGGCASGPVNPSFAVSVDDAKADLARMAREPVRLDRPVVVIGGWGDPLGLAPARLAKRLRQVTGDDRILAVGMGGLTSFDDCRTRVVERVQEAFPCDDPAMTRQVDVVGFSMGGLVARDAGGRPDGETDGRQLDIARLFCIASPIRGASAADWLGFGTLGRGMRHDADHIKRLATLTAQADYETYYYVRLNDPIVGEANAAPPGQTAWWVANRSLQLSHLHAYKDPRIVADIARRLRGETPLTRRPPAPLPGSRIAAESAPDVTAQHAP